MLMFSNVAYFPSLHGLPVVLQIALGLWVDKSVD